MIEIPTNLYSEDLRSFLWKYQAASDEEKAVHMLLLKICGTILHKRPDDSRTLDFIGKLSLSQEERDLILKYDLINCANCEVKARCCDVLSKKSGDRKKDLKTIASNSYLEVCRLDGWFEYLIRSAEIRPEYDKQYLSELLELSYDLNPYWVSIATDFLLKKGNKDLIYSEYIDPLLEQWEPSQYNSIHWTPRYLEFLLKVGKVTKEEYHYRLAMFHLEYADQMMKEQEKKPNVFNMSIRGEYDKAFKNIHKVKDQYPSEYKVIREKYEAECKRSSDAMLRFAPRTTYQIDEKFINDYVLPYIRSMHIESFRDILLNCANIPNLTTASIPVKQDKYYYELCFNKNVTIDGEGREVGICDNDISKQELAHNIARNHLLYWLWDIFYLNDYLALDFNDQELYAFCKHNKPDFIPEEKVIVFSSALKHCYKNRYLEASYMLMPFFEDSLRRLACKLKGESMTTLEKDRQIQPTLEKVLTEIEPYINSELHFELMSFFTKGYSVNYRNELLHGLASPSTVIKYTPYLAYLCLRLFFYPEAFIEISKETEI